MSGFGLGMTRGFLKCNLVSLIFKKVSMDMKALIAVVLTAVIVGGGVFFWSNQEQMQLNDQIADLRDEIASIKVDKEEKKEVVEGVEAVVEEDEEKEIDFDEVFDLDEKGPSTKVYYSKKLGVGFTYAQFDAVPDPVEITETGNKIIVSGQSIEVFEKDEDLSLKEAIEERFLEGYDPADCFVTVYEDNDQGLPNHVSAGISYPRLDEENAPFWENAGKCPQGYSETNAILYFLMNKDVPGKFLFVAIGQDMVATDGNDNSWTKSIRVLE